MTTNKPDAFIHINGRKIGKGYAVYTIAEIGINHNGQLKLALEMIHAAHESRADAVKFQIITADRCYSRQSESYPIFKKVEFRREEWETLFQEASKLGIDCFATFANPDDLRDYSNFHLPAFKISSTNVTNFPLIEALVAQKKPIIMSTGMSTLDDVREAVSVMKNKGQKEIALLQCTAIYPVPAADVNLRVIETLLQTFPDLPAGFSDHSMGINCAVASVALGASIIEKHFTLDRKMAGPDHHFSATPQEMKALVEGVREIELALGKSEKALAGKELDKVGQMRRSLVASKELKAGSTLSIDDIAIKRSPVVGLPPKLINTIVGKKIKKTLLQDDPITSEVL